MVSIFAGMGTGAERGSGALLGGAGIVGAAELGRSGGQASLNAANGNLVIAQRDEFLVGRGPDAFVSRTYNSLGNASDDNGDNWRQSTERRIKSFSANSSVIRVSGDGSEITYRWNAAANAYVTTDGAGAHDTLTFNQSAGIWTFRDGDAQTVEQYAGDGSGSGWRIAEETDLNGNTLTYAYQGANVSRVTTATGEYISYNWSNGRIDQVVTGFNAEGGGSGANATLTRTRYGYDGAGRLQTVTVDLSPEDNSVADGKVYTTSYTYDGTSKRVKTIAETDGTAIEFGYDAAGRVDRIAQTVSTDGGASVVRTTTLAYDQVGENGDRKVTVVTDQYGRQTRLEYETATGRLVKLTSPSVEGAPDGQVLRFAYNANGDVTSVTDAAGKSATYTYTASGKVDTETTRNGDTITRTYDPSNRLLTETRYGSEEGSARAAQTSRFAYDGRGNLRFAVDAQGGVTEYVYDDEGRQTSRRIYTDAPYGGAGSTPDLENWASQRDVGVAQITVMTYDARGNLRTTTSGAGASSSTTATAASVVVTNRVGTSVAQQADGLYRVTKTGSGADWDADARSSQGMSGDFVVQIRPAQNNLLMMAGISRSPDSSAHWNSLGYAFYMTQNGGLLATENGTAGISLNATYVAGDNLWLARSGSTISYYKGATYERAVAAGALRTVTGTTGTFSFDSSILNTGASFDVAMLPGTAVPVSTPIVNGANVTVEVQPDGYRLIKTGGNNVTWDADARGTRGFAGDFALGIRPASNGKILMAGMSRTPGMSSGFQDLSYAFYFQVNGSLAYMESGSQGGLPGSYSANERFWMVRSGTTLSYYRGETFESAVAGSAVRTVQNVTGTLYFDSALYQTGASVDIVMATTTPVPAAVSLTPGNNTAVAFQSETGLWRMTKTGGGGFDWDADARSSTSVSGDFVMQVRPVQRDRYMMIGLSTTPANSGSHSDLDYALYFQDNGNVFAWENRGSASGLPTTYEAASNFWIVRTGSTIAYYKGDSYDAAVAAGPLRTVQGASTAAMWVDASIAQPGASADVALTRGQSRPIATPIDAGTNTSRVANGDGTFRIVKNGGGDVTWDADARSSRPMSGDFALQVRPAQRDKIMILGLSRQPANSTGPDNLDYGFYFVNDGQMYAWEAGGGGVSSLSAYGANQNYWLIREGSTLYYGTGNDAASARQNVLRSIGGAGGDLYFDSAIYQTGAAADIGFTRAGTAPTTKPAIDMTVGIAAATGAPVATGAAGSRTTYVYDAAGQLLTRTTDTLDSETFAYDGLGRVVASKGRDGVRTSVLFNDAALQTVVTVGGEYVTTSTYNRAGDLVAVTETDGRTSVGTARTVYDRLGRVRSTIDASGRPRYFLYDAAGRRTAEIGDDGALTEYRYDAADRIVATIRYDTRLTAGQLDQVRNADAELLVASIRPGAAAADLRSWCIYDAGGRLIETIEGDGSVTRYQYDSSDRLIRTTGYYNKLEAWRLAVFASSPPDALQLPAADAGRDTVTRTFYDRAGRVLATLDGEGYLTRTTYDAAGRKTATTSYATATTGDRADGTLATLTPAATARDRTSRWVYDGQGLPRFEIDPIGRVVEYAYGSAATLSEVGQSRQTIRYAGTIGSLSNYSLASVRTAVSSMTANPDNRREWAVYDAAGRIAFAIDAAGTVSRTTYDAMGRVSKTTVYAQARVTGSLPTLGDMQNWVAGAADANVDRTTRNYYSARGDLRYSVDAEGYPTRYDYDAEGRVLAVARQDAPIYVADDPDFATVKGRLFDEQQADRFRTTRTEYDMLGRVSSRYDGEGTRTVLDYSASGTLLKETMAWGTGDSVDRRYVYDAAGRVLETYVAQGTPDELRTSTRYDGLGNVVETIDASRSSTTYEYDRAGRLRKRIDPLQFRREFEYDAFDGIVKEIDERSGATFRYYDNVGRVRAVRDAENYVTETSYTQFGETSSVTRRYNRANNDVTQYPTFGAHLKDATTSFTYDALGRTVSMTDAENKTETYTLNAFGERRRTVGKNNLVTVYAYDRRGLVQSQTASIEAYGTNGLARATQITTGFTYDSRGNRKSMTEASGLAEQRVTEYVYDKADRLIETKRQVALGGDRTTDASEKIGYDRRGNVVSRTDATGNRSLVFYDRVDRVVATVDPRGAVVRSTYVVDANGGSRTDRSYANLLGNPVGLSTATLPTMPAETSEDRVSRTTFDKLGRAASVEIENVSVGRWNNGALSTEVRSIATRYTYDADGNVVQTINPDDSVSYAYFDRLGRQSAKVDERGFLTSWIRDGEGNVLSETRYATATSGASITAMPTSITADVANDRITDFAYDRLGQRTRETRRGVAYSSVDASGVVSAAVGDVAVEYQYNALGQISRKIEATGDATSYDYDAAGRLTREIRAGFTGHDGTAVTPTLEYRYDGLGNLVRTRQGDLAVASGDRVTTYEYGKGGRLVGMNDATQAVDAQGSRHSYYYDAAGRKTGEQYARQTFALDGSSQWLSEGLSYQYDATGRLTSTAFATVAAGAFTVAGDVNGVAYNAFGDVSSRSLNGVEQERNFYDNAGRLWKSNAGDGVQRFYYSDARGNRSYAIESAGADLRGVATLAAALAQANDPTNARTVVATAMRYDGRGQLVETVQRGRELVSGGRLTDLVSTRDYNAFGEASFEQDARGGRTDYAYTTTGRVSRITRPSVDITGANGTTSSTRPYEDLGYDRSGRLVVSTDANGKSTRRRLLAGTGYGGGEALVVAEYRPDGFGGRMGYDRFGDLRTSTDGAGRTTTMTYDGLGRLVTSTNARSFTDSFTYDALGQRIRHTNSVLGSSNVELTQYDIQGRVTGARAFGGDAQADTTITTYSWNAGLSSALGTFGGYDKTITYINGRTATEASDGFGHILSSKDLGDRITTYGFDLGGRVTLRDGAEDVTYAYLNTGLAARATRSGTMGLTVATYGYDETGRKVAERTTLNDVIIQDASAVYDLGGRMTRWSEAGNALTAALRQDWRYDAVGNIRQVVSTTGASRTEQWFAYDGMNRVTIDGGILSGGQVLRGNGIAISYNGAGERATVTTDYAGYVRSRNPNYYDGDNGSQEYFDHYFTGEQVETYGYEADGTLKTVNIAQSTGYDDGDGGYGVAGPAGPGALRSSFTYDLMGRFERQVDKDANGAAIYDRRVTARDGKGRVNVEEIATGANTTRNTYDYGDGLGQAYALGQVMGVGTEIIAGSGTGGAPSGSTYGYEWFDGAQQSTIGVGTLNGTPGSNTAYAFTGSGTLYGAQVTGSNARSVTVTSDVLGQMINRTEGGATPLSETWYRFDGRQVASVGTNGTDIADYDRTISQRRNTPSSSRTGSVGADYDRSYQAINSFQQGSGQGSYTVRGGETLAGIAANLWGDAGLWYKLAQANGLSADATLIAGTTLQLPANVVRTTNAASTFRPYDPSEAWGDTSPTTPVPTARAARNNKCGAFGQILLVAVAVAVSVASYGALTGPTTGLLGAIGAGAASGAAGSVASQAVGNATGIQKGLSWKGVALAALSGAAGGALRGVDLVGGLGKATEAVNVGLRGAIGSAVTQGVGVATGLQSRFDFAGVAAAGIGAGLASAAGGRVGFKAGSFGDRLATNTAGGIANAAVRSIVNGTSFGDNLMAALPDVIGSTIGGAIGERIAGGGRGAFGGGGRPGSAGALSPVEQGFLDEAQYSVETADGRWNGIAGGGTGSEARLSEYRSLKNGNAWSRMDADGTITITGKRTPTTTTYNISNYDFSVFQRQPYILPAGATSKASEAGIVSRLQGWGRSYMAAFDQTYGPQSAYGRHIGQPFLRGLAAIGNSPLGDVGVGMAIEQAGAGMTPAGALPGAIMTLGQRGVRTLGRIAELGTLRAAESGASNIASAPKLAGQLRLESAKSPFTSSGQLTPQAIQDSRMIIPNSQIGNPRVPLGYNKYSTPTFQSPSGEFQNHFYMDPKTGKVLYDLDYKTKFN